MMAGHARQSKSAAHPEREGHNRSMRIVRIAAPTVVAFALALVWSGVLAVRSLDGLPVSPFATLVLVPVLRLVMFMSGAVALGGTIVGTLLDTVDAARRIAQRSAVVFAAASAMLAVATLADVLATEWWNALDSRMLLSFLTQIDEGRYLVLQVILGGAAAVLLGRVAHRTDAAFVAVLLAIAVALPGFTGHSAAQTTHWFASLTIIVHLLAMSVWGGGVVALLASRAFHLARLFSPIALAAYTLLMLSGIASLGARVGDWNALLHDRYLVVLLGKVLVYLAIGVIAYRMRAHMFVPDTPPASLVRRMLAVDVALMGVALAFAVTLARMPNP